MGEDAFVLEERVLCSDDACVGLVGADGRCKVCGLAYSGDEVLPTGEAAGAADGPPENIESGDTELGPDPLETDESDERVCCPDDMCIGIIGPDGSCGTCGKREGELS